MGPTFTERTLLAAQRILGNSAGAFEATFWMGALCGAILAAIIVLLWLRRRFRDSPTGHLSGFTLEALRDLRDRGELTESEFSDLRRVVVEDAQRWDG